MFASLHAPGNLPLLLACARHFSPLIEQTSPDTVVFEVGSLRLLFGAPSEIASEIRNRVGIPAGLAIAPNPDTAVHAACGFAETTVILPGEEAHKLAPLPLYLLGGSPQFAHTLASWGLRSFGDFAALPAKGVAARLGEEGIGMQRLARGEGRRLLRLPGRTPVFLAERELEDPVELLEPLLFLLSGMLNELCERLQSHAFETNEIHLDLYMEEAEADRSIYGGELQESAQCDENPHHTARIRLPVPMLDARVFLKLLQLELSGRPPQAPVEKIRLELKPVQPRTTQHGLFLPAAPEPEKLEVTLARIRHLVGASNVGAPELIDTHRPDSFRMGALRLAKPERPVKASGKAVVLKMPVAPRGSCADLKQEIEETFQAQEAQLKHVMQGTLHGETASAGSDALSGGTAGHPAHRNGTASGRSANRTRETGTSDSAKDTARFVLRRYRPPRTIQVWSDPSGHPVRVSSAALSGRVAACAGPWRTSGGWWTGQPWDHKQWDIEIAGGGLYRIHQDCRTGGWFLEGSYD